jgi:SprT protein
VNTQASVLLPREAPISKRRAPPVPPAIKARAKESLAYWVQLARERFKLALFMPTISFDLVGTTAGKALLQERHVQLNAILLTENIEHFEQDTIPHELAHLIVYHVLGRSGGHGQEWKEAMLRLGIEPKRTHNLDVTNSRTTQRVEGYICNCGPHPVSTKMHARIRRGARAWCKKCKITLHWTGAAPVQVSRPTPIVHPTLPAPAPRVTPQPTVRILRPPSESMLRYATSLAQRHKLVLPPLVIASFDACKAFLDQWSTAPVQGVPAPAPTSVPTATPGPSSVFPPTEKQLSYAKSIARRKGLTIPPDVISSKQLISRWIDEHCK